MSRALWLSLCVLPLLGACGQDPKDYAVLKVCDAPFMRHSTASVIKRISDSKVFVLYDNGVMLEADPTADVKDLCP